MCLWDTARFVILEARFRFLGSPLVGIGKEEREGAREVEEEEVCEIKT